MRPRSYERRSSENFQKKKTKMTLGLSEHIIHTFTTIITKVKAKHNESLGEKMKCMLVMYSYFFKLKNKLKFNLFEPFQTISGYKIKKLKK